MQLEMRKSRLQIEIEGAEKRKEELARRVTDIQRAETGETLQTEKRRQQALAEQLKDLTERQAGVFPLIVTLTMLHPNTDILLSLSEQPLTRRLSSWRRISAS